MPETEAVPQTASQRVAQATGKTAKKINLLDNAVCVRVKFGRFGTKRTVSNDNVTVDADTDLINVSKKLLDSPELTAIVKFDGEIKSWIYSRCLKSFLDEGMYFVGLETVKEFDQGMEERELKRATLVEALCEAYYYIRERDRTRLRTTFRDTDYVSVDKLRAAFKLSWQYLALTAPKSLEAVSEELYNKANAQINAEIADATLAVRYALREEMKKLTDWAIDRLKPGENGKKKIFRSKNKAGDAIGFTAKFNDFLSCFQGRNITDDAELQQLVEKARALLAGVDGEALRESEAQRDSVRTGFEEIQKNLDELVAEAPIRKITVE